jgi:hypothetical protein
MGRLFINSEPGEGFSQCFLHPGNKKAGEINKTVLMTEPGHLRTGFGNVSRSFFQVLPGRIPVPQ